MAESIGQAEDEQIALPITGTLEVLQFAMLRGWTFSKTDTIDFKTADDETDIVNYTAGATREDKDFFLTVLVVGGEVTGVFKLYINNVVTVPLYIEDFDSKWFQLSSPLIANNDEVIKVTFDGPKDGEVAATIFGFETSITEILQARTRGG
jgi:hypothetical protein